MRRFWCMFYVLSTLISSAKGQDNRIVVQTQDKEKRIFASGVNLAWGLNGPGDHNFARDLIELPAYTFPAALDELAGDGGNTLRWWLHTNGRYSPNFDADGKVTGLHPNTIPNLHKVLDMAYERGIVISMCLWSFDMLQDQGQNLLHMKQLLEDTTYTRTYIENALRPILEAIGNHPAVLTWEIFNEPEGMSFEFGWTPVRVEMRYIQQFINKVAGAIHRYAPGALVSNGSWSFMASTDVDANHNFYTDERLMQAGGDSLGTIDLYQVHYYPEHFDNFYSPFHHEAAYWQLDKPILIGEFPITGIDRKANPHKSTQEAYQYAFDNGYAGCMAWSWTDFEEGSMEDAALGLFTLWRNHTEDIAILPDSFVANPLSVLDTMEHSLFIVAPNPSSGLFHITLPKGIKAAVQVLDEQGKEIYTLESNNNTIDVDLGKQPAGVYLIKMSCNQGVWAKRVIKR